MTATSTIQDIVTRNMKIAMAVNDTNQQTLANELGISRSSVSQKMTHRVIWSLEDIEKAGKFFRISPAKFLEPNGLLAVDMNDRDGGAIAEPRYFVMPESREWATNSFICGYLCSPVDGYALTA